MGYRVILTTLLHFSLLWRVGMRYNRSGGA